MRKTVRLLFFLLSAVLLIFTFVACQPDTSKPTIKTYTLTFEMNGHGEQIQEQKINENECPYLPLTPIDDGWKFVGWYADESLNEEFDFNKPLTSNKTVYAKWEEVDVYYLVRFDRNGKSSQNKVPADQEYFEKNSKAVKPEDMSANYYRFMGWSLTADGSSGIYNFDTILTGSITLYAQWLRLYTVSFDLNNTEALQPAPEQLSVGEGECATKPTDPNIIGYRFNGWFLQAEGGEVVDFSVVKITANTTFYAQWTKTAVETFDNVIVPEPTEYNKEAPYGERPDLDGYKIDGIMSEKEKWEDQKWYTNSTTQAPTVSYSVSTQFSDKGLYVFFKITDNGGLYHDGQNYHFKNSNLLFHIANGESESYHWAKVKTFRVDTNNLYPCVDRVKIAINIANGEVNTSDSSNKSASMYVEMFVTWKDLDIDTRPSCVKINTVYNYKRLASDEIKYSLSTPFTDETANSILQEYVSYDGTGYIKADTENAVLGASSLGVAKTPGWDITHESDENEAYVSSEGYETQVIFFKNIIDTNYYSFKVKIDASKYVTTGKAGVIIYDNEQNYTALTFAINASTYDKTNNRFILAKPHIVQTDNNGRAFTTALSEIDVSLTGEIVIQTIFSNGYVYYILNEKLIHCIFVESLSVRTNPGLITETCEGVRFTDYSATILTSKDAHDITSQYAYVVTTGKLTSLNVEFGSIGVSSDAQADKVLDMKLENSRVVLTTTQRNNIRQSGTFDSNIQVRRIKTLSFSVNGITHDITTALTDSESGAKYGEFSYAYPFDGDAVLSNTSDIVPVDTLTAVLARVVDNDTGKAIRATATIKSTNPLLGHYEMDIGGGDMVLVMPKGFDYKITITQTGYRNYEIEQINDIDKIVDLGEIRLVPNILGGTAINKSGSFSVGSMTAGWDMTNESNSEIIFETTGNNPPTVYFSGYTVHTYQYAKISVSNITDVTLYSKYEADPAIGFMITTAKQSAFIGLRQAGLRYIHKAGLWDVVQIGGYPLDTVNRLDVDGKYNDVLEIIRLDRRLYSFINDVYMGCVILDEEVGGEAAIGVQGTFSHYGKIKYTDYEIKVGDDALLIAKQRIGANLVLNSMCYDIDENYDTDYSKPMISVSGMTEFETDSNIKNLALAGTEITISLTEFALSDTIYNVGIGKYGSLILSEQIPQGVVTMPYGAVQDVEITCILGSASIVSGKFVSTDGKHEGEFKGKIVFENGSELSFTTGEDGTFTLGVPSETVFEVFIDEDGYIAPKYVSKSLASGSKNIGEIEVVKTILGGTVKGTSYSSTSRDYYVGYDNDPTTPYEGEFAEVNIVSRDHEVVINDSTYLDFDLTFSYIRYQLTNGTANETDPGVGVSFRSSVGRETLLFHKDGVRLIQYPGAGDKIEKYGLMPYNIATTFDVRADFRLIKYGNSCYMYYKNGDNWLLLIKFDTSLSTESALSLYTTNAKGNHYVFWNVNITKLSENNIPQIIS